MPSMSGPGARPAEAADGGLVHVTLLGRFQVEHGGRLAGPWPRPSARRLCALVMLSPSLRLGRAAAGEALFPDLAPPAAANALRRALSMARDALSGLGDPGASLLQADRALIWAAPGRAEVDLVTHERSLRDALAMPPGSARQRALSDALKETATLLEDEPHAEWALRRRDELEVLRQRARLELARDRARGTGGANEVLAAWESCLAHEPSSEEAATALVRAYTARSNWQAAHRTYEMCRRALAELGLVPSTGLEEAYRAALIAGELGPPAEALRQPPAPGHQERRLATVLMAQLSGTWQRAEAFAAEEVRVAVEAAISTAIADIQRFGGTVTSVSGSGVVGLFGAPETHEDDPERAVRAAGRLVRDISAMADDGRTAGPVLWARAGVETGHVVVGPLAGTPYGATGPVLEIASALQAAAVPGSVLVGPATRAATENVFTWGTTEVLALPGPNGAVNGSYLGAVRSRPGARRHGFRATPLVGRAAEREVVEEVLHELTAGRGAALVVVGEPGLGKTRLVEECRKRYMDWVRSAPGRLPLWLAGRCLSYNSSSPYGLYAQLFFDWAGAGPDEVKTATDALERAMRAVFGRRSEHVDFMAHMMGLRRDVPGHLSPEALQRTVFAAVKSVIYQLTRAGPVVVALEDMHWADPISVRLTAELAQLVQTSPLLVLMTQRPEPSPPGPHLEAGITEKLDGTHRHLELSPLTPEDERRLAEHLLGPHAGSAEIAIVCENADGNPLFVEERFTSLVERGALVKSTGPVWALAGDAPVVLPGALERLVRARVDRLAPACQEVVVTAAVMGLEFSGPALEAVTGTNDQLPAILADLCAGGLLVPVGSGPEPLYRFRHALIHEAVYAGLLRPQRARLHARAAWALESASAERLAEVAAVLAHHFAEGGEDKRACHYYLLAARHAAGHFAVDEAVRCFRRALAFIDDDDAMMSEAVAVRAELGDVLWRSSRFDEARDVFHEALRRATDEDLVGRARLQVRLGRVEAEAFYKTTDQTRASAALRAFAAVEELLGEHPEVHGPTAVDIWLEAQVDGLANYYNQHDDQAGAAAVLARARPLAEAHGSPVRLAGLYAHLSFLAARQARFRITEATLAPARLGTGLEPHLSENEAAYCLGCFGALLVWTEALDEAQELMSRAAARAERANDPLGLSWCLRDLSVIAVRRHDIATARRRAEQTLAVAAGVGDLMHTAGAKAVLTWVAWQEGRPDEVLRLGSEVLALWREISVTYHFQALCLWPMLAVHLDMGNIDEAQRCARQMLDASQVRFPDDLERLLRRALQDAGRDGKAKAASRLAKALARARELHYT